MLKTGIMFLVITALCWVMCGVGLAAIFMICAGLAMALAENTEVE